MREWRIRLHASRERSAPDRATPRCLPTKYCAIQFGCDRIAPLYQLTKPGELPSSKIACALETHECCIVRAAFPPRTFRALELLAGPVHASFLLQKPTEFVAQAKEVASILRSVVKHIRGKRAHAPVGTLVFFVELQAKKLLEECSQAKSANTKQLRCDPRVEKIGDAPAVILVQQPQVVIGVMQHNLDAAVFQQRTEFFGCTYGERVDNCFALVGRDLEQIDAVDEAMETRAFCIERNRMRSFDERQEVVDGFDGIEIEWCGSGHGIG